MINRHFGRLIRTINGLKESETIRKPWLRFLQQFEFMTWQICFNPRRLENLESKVISLIAQGEFCPVKLVKKKKQEMLVRTSGSKSGGLFLHRNTKNAIRTRQTICKICIFNVPTI